MVNGPIIGNHTTIAVKVEHISKTAICRGHPVVQWEPENKEPWFLIKVTNWTSLRYYITQDCVKYYALTHVNSILIFTGDESLCNINNPTLMNFKRAITEYCQFQI